jgi:hypothetical protein
MFRFTIVFCFNRMPHTGFDRCPTMRSRHVADQWFGVCLHHVIHSTLVRWKVKRVVFTQRSITRINSERIKTILTGIFVEGAPIQQ